VKPLSIVRHEGRSYVVDGHYRLAAAKGAGVSELGVRDVTDELISDGFMGYCDMAEVLDGTRRFAGNRLNEYAL
jgi:hypothetical protein